MRLSQFAAGLLAVVTLVGHAQEHVSSSSGHLFDPAQLIEPNMVGPINSLLAGIANTGVVRIAVLTVPDLDAEAAGHYAQRALHRWQDDSGAGRDVLLLAAPGGVVALAAGDALRSHLSQAEAESVLVDHVLPTAARSGLSAAIIAGTQAIVFKVSSAEDPIASEPVVAAARYQSSDRAALLSEPGPERLTTNVADEPSATSLDIEQWVDDMTQALSAVAKDATQDPARFLAHSLAELREFPAVVDTHLRHSTAAAEGGDWEAALTALILLAVSLIFCVLAWRITRSVGVLLGVAGLLGALWIWGLGGFSSLALSTLVIGVALGPVMHLSVRALTPVASRGADARSAAAKSQYQAWVAAQRSAAPGAARTHPVKPNERPTRAAESRRDPPARAQAAARTLRPTNIAFMGVREQLRRAGIPTPALDTLQRAPSEFAAHARSGAGRPRTWIIVGVSTLMALAVFGPLIVLGLLAIVAYELRRIWLRIKPANMGVRQFLRQLAKETEAASKLSR